MKNFVEDDRRASSRERSGNSSGIEILSQVPHEVFEEEWYEHNSESHFWFQWRKAALVKQLKDLNIQLDGTYKALEIGCGTGLLRLQMEAVTNWTIDGADVNLKALEQAEPCRGRTLLYDVTEELPFLIGAYDIIILFDVLEHIQHTRPFLGSILKHLAPGGFLLFNAPSLPIFHSRYDEMMGHIRRYDKKTLLEEFRGFDLEILDIRYWGMSMVLLLALRTLLMRVAKTSAKETVKLGFRPPGTVFNKVMCAVMELETKWLPKPPIGTSILLVGRKKRTVQDA